MASEITKLVFQKRNKEQVNIFLDDEFAFAVSLKTALNLYTGQSLTEEEISRLKTEAEVDLAYQFALRYLGYRARSRSEVEDYLIQKGISDTAIEASIERLEMEHYLDDTAFSQTWVQNRNQSNPKGKHGLRNELKQKGVSEADISQAIAGLDEEGLAWKAVQKKLAQWQSLDELTMRKRLTSYLARRGFGFEVIETIFTQARSNEEDA